MEPGDVADGAQSDAVVDVRLADALKALFSQLEDPRSVHALASCCRAARAAWQQVRLGWMLRSVHKQRFFVRCAQQGDLPGLLHFLEGCDHGCLKAVLEEAVSAAAGSSLACLQALQAHGAPVISSGEKGHALQAAASAGNEAAVQYLLAQGAPDAAAINAALIQAVAAGATPCAQLLLDAAAAAAAAGGAGPVGTSTSPAAMLQQPPASVPAGHLLAVAAAAPVESASMVQLLLRCGQLQQEELSCAMVQAAGLGHAAICTTLVTAGAYAPEALAAAAAGGHLELLQGLLQWLPWEQHSKDLALVAAVQHGCLEAGRLIISWGATACGAFSIAGPDLLHSAVSCDSVQLLLLLMGAASGVPPELCCYYMHCALRTAVAQGNALVVRHLLTLGAPCVAPKPPAPVTPAAPPPDAASGNEGAATAAAGAGVAGASEQQQQQRAAEGEPLSQAATTDGLGSCGSEPLLSPEALAALGVQMVLPPPGVSLSPRDSAQLTSPTAASPTSPAQPSPTRPRPPTELHRGPVSPRSAKLRRRKGGSQSPAGKETASGGSSNAGSPRGGGGTHVAAEDQAGATDKDGSNPPSSSPRMRASSTASSAGTGRGAPAVAAAAAPAAAVTPPRPRRSRCLPPPLFTGLEGSFALWSHGHCSTGGGEAGASSHGSIAGAASAPVLGSPSSICSADSGGAGAGLCSSTSGLTSDEDVLVMHSHSQACTEDLGDLLAATSLTPPGSDPLFDGGRRQVSLEAPMDPREFGLSPTRLAYSPTAAAAAAAARGANPQPGALPPAAAADSSSTAGVGGGADTSIVSPSGLADAPRCSSDQQGQMVHKAVTQQPQQEQQGFGEDNSTSQLLQQQDNPRSQQQRQDQDGSTIRKLPTQQQGTQPLASESSSQSVQPHPEGVWPATGASSSSSSTSQQVMNGLAPALQHQHLRPPAQTVFLATPGGVAATGPQGYAPCRTPPLPSSAAAATGMPPWIGTVPAAPAARGGCCGGEAVEGGLEAAVAACAQLPDLTAVPDVNTPLLVVAARAGAPTVMQLLLQQPSSVEEQCAALGEAIQAGHYAVASMLLTEVKFDHQVILDALHTAIAIHNRPMVQLLMQHGADVAVAAKQLEPLAADQLLMAAAQFADTVVLPGVLRSCQYTREGLVAVVQHGLTDAVATLAEHLEPDVLVAMLVEAVLPPSVAADAAPSAGLTSSRPSSPAIMAGPEGDLSSTAWPPPPLSPPATSAAAAAAAAVGAPGGSTQREAAMQATAAAMPALLARLTNAALHVRDWLAFMKVFEYLCDSPTGPLLQTRLQGLERITTAALDRHFTALVPYFDTCLIPWLQPRLVDQAQALVSCGAVPHQGFVHDLLVSCCHSLLLGQVQLLRRGGLVVAPAWQARVYAEVLLEARIIRRQLMPCDHTADQLALGIARELSSAGVRGLGPLQFSSCSRKGGLDRRQGDLVSQQILQMLAGRSRLMR